VAAKANRQMAKRRYFMGKILKIKGDAFPSIVLTWGRTPPIWPTDARFLVAALSNEND
jgi:hypothetical protein